MTQRWILGLIFLTLPARASSLYLDACLGASWLWGANPFFSGAQQKLPALAGNTMLGFEINSADSLQFHIGVQGRALVGLEPGLVTSMIGIYPTLRIELSRIYISAGISPWVLQRSQAVAGLDSYSLAPGVLGAFTEFGVVWRVAPAFHLSIALSLDTVLTGGTIFSGATWSPFPIFGAYVAMRFYIFQSGRGGDPYSPKGRSYDGWRYPFGISKN